MFKTPEFFKDLCKPSNKSKNLCEHIETFVNVKL